jgi:hypothetical protein
LKICEIVGVVQNSQDLVGGPRKSIDTPVKSIDKAAEEGTTNKDYHDRSCKYKVFKL